ncbi:hypothetical protein [Stenotrophobium rhamnosiphilum]|uniref:Uncharacterized protein n=1 Tax=Stenotrophobium rhamnosiphilum TaxID=2029166 RepID=A0A2T5MF18_9GAMM|nr:hypothetical protein [Stenotrophobium rhamnosiphilum]PTU31139.1 hypothetical protein CJD38_12690 [Stenotrophobium rhamnosiphilum]
MNKRFLALAGLATVLSVGTYVVLNVVKPYKHETPKVADVTSPDQVFGASVDNPEAHAEGEAAAAPAPAAEGAADVAAVQPVDTAVQPAGSVDATAAATASGDGSVAPLVPAGAVAAAPAAADQSAPVDTASAEQPVAETYSEPVAEAAPAPEPAPAPAPAPKPKKKSASKSPSTGSSTWWPAEKADKLSLVYAGPASYKKAVVLMFNGAFFQADTVNANIKVTNKAGKAISGNWELGENNRRMVVFPVDAAGTYKVSIASGLTDSKGRKFGSKLGGPVQVK